MKNFKTKIFSLILCICMCLSLFSGCSLIKNNNTADADEIVMEIGDSKITRQELVDSYYSFYQQNYYYFMYYTTEDIMEIFYNSVVSREIILAEANKMLTATNGKFFSDKDMEDVWYSVLDYINTQVDAKEKSLLLLLNSDEEKLPERLQEHEHDEDEVLKYEPYKFNEIVEKDYSSDVAAPEVDIDAEILKIKDGVFTYNAAEHDEDERDMQPIASEERAKRQEAFDMYLGQLVLSAKANGKNSNKDVVLKAEIERIYESYYENALYTKYQEYINSTIAGDDKLGVDAIANKYKELLNADKESNTLEDNYIKVVTSTDTESLIMYHNQDGKYKYFTVQHVLVSFDDATLDILKEVDGYDATKDYMFREYYEEVRKTYADLNEMTTTYRDSDGKVVYKTGSEEKDTKTVQNIIDEFEVDIAGKIAELRAKPEYAGWNDSAITERARTLLFQEYAWKYSGDKGSLTNDKLSGVLGFTISGKPDEHGSLVKDFANGARALLEGHLKDGEAIGEVISPVVSDYGVHLMMLTGVYDEAEVVSVLGKTNKDIVDDLKKTYISGLTEQTLYHYVYDLIVDGLTGENGTHFSDYRNSLMEEYEESDLIKYHNKLTYEELDKAINGK